MFVLKVPEFTHTNERLILTIFGLQLSGPSFDQFVDLLRGVPKRDSGRGTNVKYRRQPCISAFASMPEAALPRALNLLITKPRTPSPTETTPSNFVQTGAIKNLRLPKASGPGRTSICNVATAVAVGQHQICSHSGRTGRIKPHERPECGAIVASLPLSRINRAILPKPFAFGLTVPACLGSNQASAMDPSLPRTPSRSVAGMSVTRTP